LLAKTVFAYGMLLTDNPINEGAGAGSTDSKDQEAPGAKGIDLLGPKSIN